MFNVLGISFMEYRTDPDLYRRLESLMLRRLHIPFEQRLQNELQKRAACGGLNEEHTINMIIIRDRARMLADLDAMKEGTYHA